jgi:hypothetical protein
MNNFDDYEAPKRISSRRKRQESIFVLLFGAFLSCMCAGIVGFAFYLGGYNPFLLPFNLTATALSQRNASCQILIDKAIQASDSYCGETNSNNVCYGNTTIQAELAPGATRRFSERGDIISVDELRRLSAAPLNLENDEWGIAVFKVIANLPRSLPGETITMVVFGNTTLDKQSGGLESFYFYSELGQIACEAVPSDGLMLTSPTGSGLRINVNGTELTLKGNANLKAVKNGEMEVSLFSGSGRIVSNGEEQYFGAGQKISVGLGGENGTQSITGPSTPEPLTEAELNTACAVTGQYCSQSQITPVSEAEAQQQLQTEFTFTPTTPPTQTATIRPSPTLFPTFTSFVLPSWTPSPGPPTSTHTLAPTQTRTRTLTPTRTRTRTPTAPLPRTSTHTNTPTQTLMPTITSTFTPSTPSPTPLAPTEPECSVLGISVSLSTLTLTPNLNELTADITNSSGAPIDITRFFAYWVKSPTSQKLDKLFLNTIEIWNRSDPDTPSDFPTEGGSWASAALTIPDATTRNFVIQFQFPLEPGTYDVHIVFHPVSCQVSGSITLP